MISSRAFDSAMPPNRKIDNVERAIYLIRGPRIMLDSDLAAIYGTRTMRLNEQFRRNRKRFPDDFAFVLTREEFARLISQIAISKKGRGGRRKLPIAFTEHGAIMLASVLNSDVAVQASVRVVRAFVRLREMVAANAQLAGKLAELELRLGSHDEAIANLFAALKQLVEPTDAPKRREIGFHVREEGVRYRVRKAPRIKNRNSRIS